MLFPLALIAIVVNSRIKFEPLNVDVESEKSSTHVPFGSTKIEIDGIAYNSTLHTLTRTGTKINGQVFGQVYDTNGNAAFLHWAADYSGILEKDGRLWMLTHFEAHIGMLYLSELRQNQTSGALSIISTRPLIPSQLVHPDFKFISNPCSGSVTPWKSFLSSQEFPFDPKWFHKKDITSEFICTNYFLGANWDFYPHKDFNSSLWRFFNKTCDHHKSAEEIKEEFYENYGSYYWRGVIIETEILLNGTARIVPHFSMGRISAERPLVMPDGKTVYITEDFYTQGFYKFVADNPGDLSAGTLYAAKFSTINGQDDLLNAELTVDWIDLGHATDSQFDYDSFSSFNTSTWFDVAFPDDAGDCPSGFRPFLMNNFETDMTECIKLKAYANRTIASRLETQRYAAWLNATQEMSKTEGLAFNSDLKDRIYLGVSSVYKGMLDNVHHCDEKGACPANSSWDFGGPNDIRLAENLRGCVMEMLLDTSFSGNIMRALVCGKAGSFNRVDNVGYVHGHKAIILSEDTESRPGPSNYAWLHDLKSKETMPILQGVNHAEIANGYTYAFGDFTYLLFTVQHPYQFDQTLPSECDSQGTKPECGEYTGTADWIVYYQWPPDSGSNSAGEDHDTSPVPLSLEAGLISLIGLFVLMCCFVSHAKRTTKNEIKLQTDNYKYSLIED